VRAPRPHTGSPRRTQTRRQPSHPATARTSTNPWSAEIRDRQRVTHPAGRKRPRRTCGHDQRHRPGRHGPVVARSATPVVVALVWLSTLRYARLSPRAIRGIIVAAEDAIPESPLVTGDHPCRLLLSRSVADVLRGSSNKRHRLREPRPLGPRPCVGHTR
jgi:hypothetical protein